MSEKIIVTVEQNERIKEFLKVAATKGHVLINHIDGWVADENKVLNALTVDKMARILYEPGSFEVEQREYQLGDWVTRISVDTKHPNRKIGRTFKVCGKRFGVVTDSDIIDHHHNYIRLATPEEILFAKLGRKLNEIKFNDTLMLKNGDVYRIVTNRQKEEIEKSLSAGDFIGFYPSESFVTLP